MESWNIRWGISPIFVVLTLLCSSFVVLGNNFDNNDYNPEIGPVHGARDTQDAKTPLIPNWRTQYDDFALYADSEGLVDVIVYSPKGLVNSLAQEKAKHIYDSSFPGFSASMTVSEIQTLLDFDSKIQIMPDLMLNASVTIQYNSTGADILWNQTDGSGNPLKGGGIVVAVIDTGISYSHPDLGAGFGPSYRVIGGYDYVNNDDNPNDDNGHGTHCAGIIGANGTIKGMAPECSFIAYKVLGSGGSGYMSDAVLAIQQSMDPNDDEDTSDHVDVISMSMGGAGSYDDATCLAVQAAIDVGIVVVVAAGNDGPTFGSVSSPGLAMEAITVGSVGTSSSSNTISSFSSRGTQPNMYLKPEICAPGYAIYSTYLYSSYASMSGTSMSTPHVAGACALLIQNNGTWTPDKVKSAIVSGAYELPNSIWNVGAGKLWVPNASMEEEFSYPAMASYTDYGVDFNISINNTGALANFTITTDDWHTLTSNYSLNGTLGSHDSTSLSSVDIEYIELGQNETGYLNLQVSLPGVELPEGYYSGIIYLTNDSSSFSIQFGFAVMSFVSVYAMAEDGHLIDDTTGAVYIYNTPGCNIVRTRIAATSGIAPPMTTYLPSGNYSIYAFGHVSIYTYDDPYLLHGNFTVNRLTDRNVYLNLTEARKFNLNLSTIDDLPIFVKEFRFFWRHVGVVNLSAHQTNGDYTIEGSEIFTLEKSKTMYVSDTTDQIGIALVGYGYSSALWDFMALNYDHWYEYVTGTATNFNLVSTTDLQYLLSWEFDHVDADTDPELKVNWSLATAYETKYNIPGMIVNPYQNWGTHKGMGAAASFFIRRDTGTALEVFFSGMNRTTIVQGPHLELYFPLGIFEGQTKDELYENDWNHVLAAAASNVYVTDRNYVTELSESNTTREIGTGPAYVSAYMENTATWITLYHPFFRETEDVRFDSKTAISSNLYRGTGLVGIYSLAEASTMPGAMKKIELTWGAGTYSLRTTITPCTTVSTSFTIEYRFTVPGTDYSPPRITGFELDHRFTPGESMPVLLEAVDDISGVTTVLNWRNGTGDSWHSVSLSESPSGNFTGSIATLATTATVDLKVNVSDATGNYLTYTVLNYAYAEVDVIFDLYTNWTGTPQIPYSSQEQYLTLYGNLTDSDGDPLHTSAGVPLDLFVDGIKIATILDEYVTTGAHTHNGSIRYEWHFTPTEIFTASGQTKTVTVFFDIGAYEPITVQFEMDSIAGPDIAPQIRLYSPNNNSAFVNGTLIDLDIEDESLLTVNYSLDGEANVTYAWPYKLDTSDWSEGYHNLTVNAMDSNTTTTRRYTFRVDRNDPQIEITYPADMGSVYATETVTINVFDNSSVCVYWSVDDGVRVRDYPYYGLALTGYTDGWYNVTCIVHDPYGHIATDTVQLYVESDSPQLTNSPGTVGTEAVEYNWNATCTSPDSGDTWWQLVTNATWLLQTSNSSTYCQLTGTPISSGYYWSNLSLNDTNSNDFVNWTITVTGDLPSPSITTSPTLGVREDFEYVYDANADQGVTWTLSSNASWLSIVSGTGVISGTPNNSFSELSYYANASCSNANGTDYQNYTIFVYNTPPAFNLAVSPSTSCVVHQPYSYEANHSDKGIGTPPGNFTTVITNFTGSYSFTSGGLLTFTPTTLGEAWFNITADDQRGVDNSTSTLNWTVTFTTGGLAYITSTPVTTANEDLAYSYSLTANQTVTWGLITNASWLSLVGSSVQGTPTNAHSNQIFNVNVSANTMNGTAYQNFSLSVLNRAPTISSTPSLSVANESAYSYNAITDDEGIGIPPGNYTVITTNYFESYSFTKATGVLSFTANLEGLYWFNITFDDQTGASNSTIYQNWTITITAGPMDWSPTFTSSPDLTAMEGSFYSYSATCNESVTWGVVMTSNATWLTWTQASHTVWGTSDESDVGSYYVNITATSTEGTLEGYQNYTVGAEAGPDWKPTFTSISDTTTTENESYTYTATCNETVTWGIAITTNATWLTWTSANHTIWGTPGNVGSYYVNISATSTLGHLIEYENWTITVLISESIEEPESYGSPEDPDADFAYSYDGLTVSFLDMSKGDNIVSWQWSFGDGTISTERNPFHTYGVYGTYTVTLTIYNTAGESSTITKKVRISIEQELLKIEAALVVPLFLLSAGLIIILASHTNILLKVLGGILMAVGFILTMWYVV